MDNMIRQPLIVLALSFFIMWLSARIGLFLRRRQLNLEEDPHQDLDLIVAATLTLLALIIGFSFSMAISRKNYEEAEANAIGTEYLQADLLPATDKANLRALLRNYLDQRILFYETAMKMLFGRSMPLRLRCKPNCGQLSNTLAGAQPTPVVALAVSG